ncbi:hypothetical protein [Halomicrococcus gelatinilyticus]|uniref:hypothetical protein n=1 Tax=Halomicrococcus gelatinilyticus TaxID=1702103 RepID=UPI002E0D4DB0
MFRKLRDHDGTPLVALDKDELRIDNVLSDDGEIPDDQQMHVQRLGEGADLVRSVTEDQMRPLSEVMEIPGL